MALPGLDKDAFAFACAISLSICRQLVGHYYIAAAYPAHEALLLFGLVYRDEFGRTTVFAFLVGGASGGSAGFRGRARALGRCVLIDCTHLEINAVKEIGQVDFELAFHEAVYDQLEIGACLLLIDHKNQIIIEQHAFLVPQLDQVVV